MVMQQVLGNKKIGSFFFKQIAKPKVVRNILLQAYRRPEAVTDELIDILMTPAQDRGAADVFLAFTRYSQGPLPEDLLPQLTCPTVLLWGTEDQFIPLEGLGHCPQDEAPEVVNPVLLDWIAQHQSN